MDGNASSSESISDSLATNIWTSSLSSQVKSMLTSYLNAEAECSSLTITNKNSSRCHSNESEDSVSESPRPIPVVTGRLPPASQPMPPPWHDEYQRRPADLPSTRKTIRGDNRLLTAASLQSFSAPNCRSIMLKIRNIVDDIKLRNISCILASEIWTKNSCKRVQKEMKDWLKWMD